MLLAQLGMSAIADVSSEITTSTHMSRDRPRLQPPQESDEIIRHVPFVTDSLERYAKFCLGQAFLMRLVGVELDSRSMWICVTTPLPSCSGTN